MAKKRRGGGALTASTSSSSSSSSSSASPPPPPPGVRSTSTAAPAAAAAAAAASASASLLPSASAAASASALASPRAPHYSPSEPPLTNAEENGISISPIIAGKGLIGRSATQLQSCLSGSESFANVSSTETPPPEPSFHVPSDRAAAQRHFLSSTARNVPLLPLAFSPLVASSSSTRISRATLAADGSETRSPISKASVPVTPSLSSQPNPTSLDTLTSVRNWSADILVHTMSSDDEDDIGEEPSDSSTNPEDSMQRSGKIGSSSACQQKHSQSFQAAAASEAGRRRAARGHLGNSTFSSATGAGELELESSPEGVFDCNGVDFEDDFIAAADVTSNSSGSMAASFVEAFDSFDEDTLVRIGSGKSGRARRASRRLQSESKASDGLNLASIFATPSAHRNMRDSFMAKIWRYPLLLVIFVIITLDLVILTIIRTGVAFYEHLILWRGRHKKMRDFLDWAGNYDEWKEAAENLDAFLGLDSWKSSPDGASSLYNERLVKKTTARLRRLRGEVLSIIHSSHQVPSDSLVDGTAAASRAKTFSSSLSGTSTLPLQLHHHHPLRLLLRTLADACRRNHGGVANETLYSHTYVGTKPAVGAFHGEVLASISTVAQLPSSLLAANEKRAFFRSLSQNYGRTALCLSGGASLAYYHIGVLKALFDQNLLPEVITGSSAGALMAAIVCCRTDEEIRSEGLLSTDVTDRFCIMADPWSIRLKRWWQKGYMFDPLDGFEKSGYFTMGHLTFLEAYKRTRRILCIAVTPDEPGRTMPAKVLNFLTAPDIVISSVICATCAIPGVLPAGQLLSKDPTTGVLHPARGSGKLWRDGSIRMDIPDLSMLNIGFSIVSQVNPHIVPFFFEPEGSAGNPTAGYRGGRGWRGGFWAAFGVHAIDYDLKKWMALMRDLRLVPPIAGADVSQVFLQMFEGDVTILPCRLPRLLWDCARLLEDPERSWLGQCISKGQTATFAKVAAVRDRLGIEVAIREAREQLEKRPAHNEDGWNSAEGARVEWMRRGSVTDEWKGRREWDRLT